MLPATPSQTIGPFFAPALCATTRADLVAAGSQGALRLHGRVLDGAGAPVPDAMVELWQAGAGWGRCGSDAEGRFAFSTVRPGRLPDGAGGRQAPHVELLVFARGLLKPVLTRAYFADEVAANAQDRLLTALSDDERATLLADPAGSGAWSFDVRLQGTAQTVFFAYPEVR